jgi:uncharacterized protein YraI
MALRHWILSVALVVVLAACNLSSEPDDLQPLVTATGITSGRPTVTITSPANGSEVVLNAQVLISATASDSVGVQRVQLIANGQIVKTVSSEAPSGDTTMNAVLDYTPRTEGTINLQVIAYRGASASEPAALSLVVRQNVQQVTATSAPVNNAPVIDPNDPTCRVLTSTGLNLRSGPSTNYNVITVLAAGTVAPIVGRIGTNEWWQVRVNTTIGWVSGAYTNVYGNCTGVPIVNPPASPTSPVTPTVAPTWTPLPTWTPAATATPAQPDLVINNVTGPETLSLSGGAEVVATYAVTITNVGGAIPGQFNNVLIKNPGNVEIPLGVVAGLGRDQSILLTVEVTFGAAGDYTLQFKPDSNNNVSEFSEVNNNALLEVKVNS